MQAGVSMNTRPSLHVQMTLQSIKAEKCRLHAALVKQRHAPPPVVPASLPFPRLCREKHPSAELLIPAKLDLAEPASIRAFAKAYRAQNLSCHILINNAGATNLKEFFTSEGVYGLPQVGLLCRAQPSLQPCMISHSLRWMLLASQYTTCCWI